MSENYVVFIEQPIKMDLLKIVTGKLRGKSISECCYWDPTLNTIFHLIHKKTGEVRFLPWLWSSLRMESVCELCPSAFQVSSVKYVAQAFSTFHQINAFEEDGFLIVDLCASDDGQAINNYNIQNLRKSGEALDEVSSSIPA